MGAIEELTAQLEGLAGDTALDPVDRVATLTGLRERLSDVVGYADRLIALQHRAREEGAAALHRARHFSRELADLHEAAVAEGIAEAAYLEAAAVPSHRTLDELAEEGLEPEAAERLAEAHSD